MPQLISGPGREAALAEIVTALSESRSAVVSSLDTVVGPGDGDMTALIPCCAVCTLAERSAERALKSFFAEFVNDPEVRVRFRKARGFCRQHSPLLTRCGDALGVAILYSDLADEALQRWRAGVTSPKNRVLSRWFSDKREIVCPSCVIEAEAEARYTAALAEGLRTDRTVWEVVEGSTGLCVRHVEQIAAASTGADAARLLGTEGAKLNALYSELEEFVRKNDYRFRGEEWGAERDAWRRALGRLRG